MGRHLPVGDGQVCQVDQVGIKPLPVRVGRGIIIFTFLVGNNPLFPRVNEKHFPGCQSGLLHNMLRSDIQDTHLGGEDQPVVISDIVSGRPEAVSVKGGPEDLAVGKKDGCRSVPGLHHGSIVMIEVLPGLTHKAIVLPGLGNQSQHGQGQVHAVHIKEFQSVIQHGRIGSIAGNNRVDPVLVLV